MVTPVYHFIGDDVFSEPDCISDAYKVHDCFVLGKDGNLQRMVEYTSSLFFVRTSPWTSVSELRFKDNLSCVYLTHDRHYHCYMISRDNTLYEGIFEVVDPNQRNYDVSVPV